MQALWSFYSNAKDVPSVQHHLKLSRSDILIINFPSFISKYRNDEKTSSYAYDLIEMITMTNSEFDLIDIIGNDQRIRDGVMD